MKIRDIIDIDNEVNRAASGRLHLGWTWLRIYKDEEDALRQGLGETQWNDIVTAGRLFIQRQPRVPLLLSPEDRFLVGVYRNVAIFRDGRPDR